MASAGSSCRGPACSSSSAEPCGPQREDHQAAEPEGEAERWTAREHVLGARPQDVAREGVGDGQQIAVEVHTALGAPGGSRGERDQRDIVGGGVHGPVRTRPVLGQPQQIVGPVPSVRGDLQPRYLSLHQIVDRPDIAQRMADPGDRTDGGELLGPLLRQDGHGDRARLEHGEPAGGQMGGGGAAQQDPVAGDDPQIGGQDMGDPVDPVLELSVAPRRAVGGAEGGTVGSETGDGGVEEFGGAVQPVRIVQLGETEDQFRPLVLGWQMLSGKAVDVR